MEEETGSVVHDRFDMNTPTVSLPLQLFNLGNAELIYD